MITPLPRSTTVSMADEQLPPSWLASQRTAPRPPEDVGGGLYTTGPQGVFRQRLAEGIRSASEVVLVASFLLSDPTIASALLSVSEGVRVYVLTASEQRLSALPREDDLFELKRIEEHKGLLDKLAGRVTVRTAAHFHAKFVVIDPWTSPRAWISTANLNPALTDSVELGVELDPRSAASLAGWFARAFWLESERELAARGRLAEVAPPPSSPARPQTADVFVTARDERGLAAEALRIIRGSSRSLVVCSYGFDAEHATVKALIERARAGVKVTVIMRPRPNVCVAALALSAAGARVVAHDKLHAKAIAGDAGALIMTANLEPHGMDEGFETGVRLAPTLAFQLEQTLAQWADGAPWTFAASARHGDHLGALLLADKPVRDGRREVVSEISRTLPAVTAASALALDAAPPPRFPPFEGGAQLPHRVKYFWSVAPPRLLDGATPVLREVEEEVAGEGGAKKTSVTRRPYDPPVYQRNDQRFVVLQKSGDADAARRLAETLDATVVVP